MNRFWKLPLLNVAVLSALVLTCCPINSGAQMAAASGADPAKVYDAIFSRIEKQVVGLADAMPEDKYDFAPSAKYFAPGTTVAYDGVSTFGGMVAHLAGANLAYFGPIMGNSNPEADIKKIDNLKTKTELMQALRDSFAYGHKAIASLTAANVWEPVDVFGQKMSRTSAATACMVHAMDHYGQMVEYLRMNGIIPPASRKSS